jgi:hypothetical protein
MAKPVISPLNDLDLEVRLEAIGNDGKPVPLTSGPVGAFVALDKTSTTPPADASLVATCTYTGAKGKWKLSFAGSSFQPALLATLFGGVGAPAPVIIIEVPQSVRRYIECTYADAAPAVVE